jgi:hypothetical protein
MGLLVVWMVAPNRTVCQGPIGLYSHNEDVSCYMRYNINGPRLELAEFRREQKRCPRSQGFFWRGVINGFPQRVSDLVLPPTSPVQFFSLCDAGCPSMTSSRSLSSVGTHVCVGDAYAIT